MNRTDSSRLSKLLLLIKETRLRKLPSKMEMRVICLNYISQKDVGENSSCFMWNKIKIKAGIKLSDKEVSFLPFFFFSIPTQFIYSINFEYRHYQNLWLQFNPSWELSPTHLLADSSSVGLGRESKSKSRKTCRLR